MSKGMGRLHEQYPVHSNIPQWFLNPETQESQVWYQCLSCKRQMIPVVDVGICPIKVRRVTDPDVEKAFLYSLGFVWLLMSLITIPIGRINIFVSFVVPILLIITLIILAIGRLFVSCNLLYLIDDPSVSSNLRLVESHGDYVKVMAQIVTKEGGTIIDGLEIKGIDLAIKQGQDKIGFRCNVNKYRMIDKNEVTEFIQALASNGFNKGIFVSTSSFTKEAKKIANNLVGISVILIGNFDLKVDPKKFPIESKG
ncbi:MAG: restriction endonuclease [Thaumarchaeota archaeon]|nr:restriction endonuclease [Nitrososphaerota archaeon]